ncbi:uncharacterized protein LOC132935747 [Metopolophium dirhodum]|uniref:uncharacterized protein LOC132935747 n=1 Tax=Metopolophium dirhodum TaxID=44670 RepID=UPI002990724D|nr:uncharacterized protein LOC132935747 [Metopolophium dirhodum]
MAENLDDIEDIAVLALLLDEEEKINNSTKQKRLWVHAVWKKIKTEGEFATLYKELVDHETKFFEYFRMPQYGFNVLLHKIEHDIKKQDTFWREAITPRERLAVCLRFLATGDSFTTISFSYRLGHTTVYRIVIETCKSIVTNLMSEVMPQPTEERWKQIANDFWTNWNFPNCIGALDENTSLFKHHQILLQIFLTIKKHFLSCYLH